MNVQLFGLIVPIDRMSLLQVTDEFKLDLASMKHLNA
jgi:hypothetical protein